MNFSPISPVNFYKIYRNDYASLTGPTSGKSADNTITTGTGAQKTDRTPQAAANAGAAAASAFTGAAAAGIAGAPGAAGNAGNDAMTAAKVKALKRLGQIECETCKNRQYQDGSNDPGVSFKAPGHIDPNSAASVVMSHEQEHVSHEQANAKSEGRKVIAQSVVLTTAICPECGRAYVSGGQTTTTTAADSSKSKSSQYNNAATAIGQNINVAV